MDDATRLQENHDRWNELVGLHMNSPFYRLDDFKAGWNPLDAIVRSEVGDVTGKRLLHLQCHFGMNTLALARMGAHVTGLDFSENAVAAATELSVELQIPARFVCSDALAADRALAGEEFDMVYVDYGAVSWLPDINRWAEVVNALLAPGGTLYMAEVHPVGYMFDDLGKEGADNRLQTLPYFFDGVPFTEEIDGSYADSGAVLTNKRDHSWCHTIGEILTAITRTGLHLEFFHEHRTAPCVTVPGMSPDAEGVWHLPEGRPNLPLTFSLRAIKH